MGSIPLLSGRTIGLIISTAILYAILAVRSRTFVSEYTTFVISRQVGIYVLIALSQALCLVVGGMNLSVGAIGSISTVVLGIFLDKLGLPGWISVPAALSAGLMSGLINGMLITKLGIDSFIVTLSMMFVFMGLRSGISGGAPYAVPDSFKFVGQESLKFTVSGNQVSIPYVVIITALVLIAIAYMFRNTVFGRRLLATGGNKEAARLSGINTGRMIVSANVISGVLASLAAIIYASRMGSAAPETGDDWLIISFAVAIIGGTGLSGGVISAFGILMGATIFQLIQHALVEMRVDPYYANSFLGGLILLTIVIDRVREIYSGRKRS